MRRYYHPPGMYLRDLRGLPVKAPTYKPSGDQNPEGKAARRRRKQMERQLQKQVGPIELVPPIEPGCDACGAKATARCPFCQAATCGKCSVCEHGPQIPPVEAQHAADSSEASRADRQDPAWEVDPNTQHATLEELAGDASGYAERIPKEHCARIDTQMVLESSPTNGPGLAQRLYANHLVDNTLLANLMAFAKPGAVIRPVDPGEQVFMGVDPGSPEGVVTTVAIRKGTTVMILDEAARVPQRVWDEMAADVSRRINERIAAELGGGTPPPMSRARSLAKAGAPHHSVLAALAAELYESTKPKE